MRPVAISNSHGESSADRKLPSATPSVVLLSKDTNVTLAVALGNFLAADDSPWELLMTTGLIYALPPAAIYYVFRRYMVSGLTAGAVKS